MITRITWENGTTTEHPGTAPFCTLEGINTLGLSDSDMGVVEVEYRGEALTDIPFALVARVEFIP